MPTIDDPELHEAANAYYTIYEALRAKGFGVDDLEVHLALLAKCFGFVAAGIPPELRHAAFRQISDVGGEIARRLNDLYGYPPKVPLPH